MVPGEAIRQRGRQMRRQAVHTCTALALLPLLLAACGGSAIHDNLDDATITTRVKSALMNAPGVDATRIDVSTSQGVVTLSGVAKNNGQAQKAVSVARGIAGVKDVKSDLQVGPGGEV